MQLILGHELTDVSVLLLTFLLVLIFCTVSLLIALQCYLVLYLYIVELLSGKDYGRMDI